MVDGLCFYIGEIDRRSMWSRIIRTRCPSISGERERRSGHRGNSYILNTYMFIRQARAVVRSADYRPYSLTAAWVATGGR